MQADVSLARRRAIAIALEADEGVPEVITAADIIPARNIVFTPDIPDLELANHSDTLSNEAPAAGRSSAKVSFETDLYGGSAAGTAGFIGKILQMARNSETIVAATSCQYLPATVSLKSATVKVWIDGISHQLTGCRATVGFSFKSGMLCPVSIDIQGLWDPTTDADAFKDEDILTATALPSVLPKKFQAANLSIDGTYKLESEGFDFQLGNTLTMLPDSNVTAYQRILIDAVNPEGKFDSRLVTKVTKDFYALLKAKTTFQLRGVHGADEGGDGVGLVDSFTDASLDKMIYRNTGGVGTLNTLTKSGAGWATSRWVGWRLIDAAGTTFYISANTATALTVVGTPTSGAFQIKPPKTDYGTAGTGTLNTWTDATKAWTASQFAGGFVLIDNAGVEFAISANDATTLTVTGTPATGAYKIIFKVRDTLTVVGTTNTATDGTKSWPTNKWVGAWLTDSAGTRFEITANTGTALTVSGTPANGAGTIAFPMKNWLTNQWAGYRLMDASWTSFAITANDATSLTLTGTPAPGPYHIYQAGQLFRITLPKITAKSIADSKSGNLNKMDIAFRANRNTVGGDDEWEFMNY